MGGCRWKRGEKQRSRQGTVHQSHRSQGLDGDRETQGLWDPLESEVPPGPDPNLGWHSQVQGLLQVAQFPFDFCCSLSHFLESRPVNMSVFGQKLQGTTMQIPEASFLGSSTLFSTLPGKLWLPQQTLALFSCSSAK